MPDLTLLDLGLEFAAINQYFLALNQDILAGEREAENMLWHKMDVGRSGVSEYLKR